MLDEDGGASAPVPAKKDAKAPAEKPAVNKKVVDLPPKKEKQAKSEEPAAPLGKEQRGGAGRDQKPRGRGRDNKGGLRKAPGTGREFDRRSGPSATHRNPREGKRQDRGAGNWGNELEESTIAASTTDPQPTSPPPPAEENKTEAAATEVKDAEHKDAKPEEEEDKTITYDQFLKLKDSKAPKDDKLEARAVENDESQFNAAKPVKSKKKADEDKEEKEAAEKSEKAGRSKKKNVVTLDEFNATHASTRAPRESRPRADTAGSEPRGGGRGRGRGTRGGGRGGPSRGGGGGRGQRGHAPDLNEDSFPKLGK